MDPIATPLLIYALGNLAHTVFKGACEDFLKDKLKGLFSKAEKLGGKDDLQLAYETALQQGLETFCEIFLRNIETFAGKRAELMHYRESLELFIKDPGVAAELFRSVEDPNDKTAPSPEVLAERWKAIDGRELPSDLVIKDRRCDTFTSPLFGDSPRKGGPWKGPVLLADSGQEASTTFEGHAAFFTHSG